MGPPSPTTIIMATTTTTEQLLDSIANLNNTTATFLAQARASRRDTAQTRLVEGLRQLAYLCNETNATGAAHPFHDESTNSSSSCSLDRFSVTLLPLEQSNDERLSEDGSPEIFQAVFVMSCTPVCLSQVNAVAAVLLYNLAFLNHCAGVQSGTSRRVTVALKLYQQSLAILEHIPDTVPESPFHATRNILVAALLLNMAFAYQYFFDQPNAAMVFRDLAQHVQASFPSTNEHATTIPGDVVSYFENALLFNLGNLSSGHQPSPAA